MTKDLHVSRYTIDPGTKVDLAKYDPRDTSGFEGKDVDEPKVSEKLNEDLRGLQEKLWAEHEAKVLVVLQGMDTAGKDGIIHRVFMGVNPQGVQVAHFGMPNQDDLDHDFLWRVHQKTPGKGEIVIFNRSHYESVLVERVHKLVPDSVWGRRYKEINDWEKLLADDDCTVLKFYLHISKDEQKKRLEERIADPTKEWKFSSNDIPERRLWDEYMKAYQDMLSLTSTEYAPWHWIPSNHKWYRDLVVSRIIVKAMEKLDLHYPKPVKDLATVRIP